MEEKEYLMQQSGSPVVPRIVPLVIVSPVRDEADYIELTLQSMVAQTVRPREWIVVDDGSSDNTPEIVLRYAEQYPFIRLVRRSNRGFRKLGGGVIAAFKEGLAQVTEGDYAYLAKLDGDMSLGPRYLEKMFEKFAANPRLATVSGKVFRPEDGRLIEEAITEEHVAGQFKLYRREAYEAIGGFLEAVLWDGIDVHSVRMHGWDTMNFHDPEALLYHHRLMGSSDKHIWRGRLRWGRGIHFMGYHPLYALASGVFRMRETPFILGGLLIICGYMQAALSGAPRYDNPEFIRYLRKWQLHKLKRMLTGSTC
jgi:glycosyltransferase involved in cell wall biosynthesis